MEEIIRTVNLTKQYGNKVIVDRVSISVKKGEIYGFLGLNGAGKTTTIRALLGMSKPSSGEVYLFGQRWANGNPDLSRRVGYMVEVPYAYPTFTVRENLSLMARLRGLPVPRAVDEIMEQLNLTQYADSKARDLSLGNAQKLGLAKALIHKPDVLILEELTNALDPAGIVEIREMLKALASQQGVTVFISSHILEEMSKMASRIGIIHKGVLLEELTTKDFETIRRKQLMIGRLKLFFQTPGMRYIRLRKTALRYRMIMPLSIPNILRDCLLNMKYRSPCLTLKKRTWNIIFSM